MTKLQEIKRISLESKPYQIRAFQIQLYANLDMSLHYYIQ